MSRLLASRQLVTKRVCFDVSYVNGQIETELVSEPPDEPKPATHPPELETDPPEPVTPPLSCTEGAMGLGRMAYGFQAVARSPARIALACTSITTCCLSALTSPRSIVVLTGNAVIARR